MTYVYYIKKYMFNMYNATAEKIKFGVFPMTKINADSYKTIYIQLHT